MDNGKLRKLASDCVHCGFCLPACPTYALWGEEMDSPRGRIHLVTQVLDGAELSPAAAEHFDRCLGCMACMTACPSGVQYDRLIEAARAWTDDPAHALAVNAGTDGAGMHEVAGVDGPEVARGDHVTADAAGGGDGAGGGRETAAGSCGGTCGRAVRAGLLWAGGGTGRGRTGPHGRRSSRCSPIRGGCARWRPHCGFFSAPAWTGWSRAAGCRAASPPSSARR